MSTPVPQGITRSPRTVQLISGNNVVVQTNEEALWFEATRDAYRNELKFTERTDLIDLDRMLALELMVFRWTQHSASGFDYDGDLIDDKFVTGNLKLFSDQLNKVKESMGLNKKARDDAANEGNFAAWLADLKSRAKIFGIHREHQTTKAIALFKELAAVLGAFDRSDEEERRKIGFETEKDIVDWIRKVAIPEFDEIDAFFRENEQRYWVRDN